MLMARKQRKNHPNKISLKFNVYVIDKYEIKYFFNYVKSLFTVSTIQFPLFAFTIALYLFIVLKALIKHLMAFAKTKK